MDFIGGTDTLLTFVFEKSGEPLVPDISSVKYTVLNHAGTPIVGLIDIPIITAADTWQVHFVVPAINNTIDVGKKFERRTVFISYTTGGKYERGVLQYRLIPLMNFSAQPKDVRAFIGVQEKELPDEDIDLLSAYLYVERDLGTTAIAPLLSSGTILELAVNNAIKAKAVLDVLPSIRQRMAQEETNGVTGFKRLKITDFVDIEAKALALYAEAFVELLNTVEESLTLVLVTEDADPITG